MPVFPTVDESQERLHRAGWSISNVDRLRRSTRSNKPMPALPTPDECRLRLLLAGWAVTESFTGSAYHIFGTRGEHRIEARAATRGGAWRQACQQAEALGLLDEMRKED